MKEISGIILTKNNESTIKDSVLSILPLVSELIIIDDLSEDKTQDIIKDLGGNIKIVNHKLERFDNQRNLGISLAKNDWILMIDSDEIISQELSESIKNINTEENILGYWAVRENRITNKKVKEDYKNRPILFKNNLRFSYPVHETILIDQKKLKKIKGNLIHKNWESFKKSLEKANHYSELMADRWIEENRNYGKTGTLLLALLWPAHSFLQAFFGRRQYRLGLFGLVYSIFESYWRLAGILKFYEKKYRCQKLV